jgi:hypothetical protein
MNELVWHDGRDMQDTREGAKCVKNIGQKIWREETTLGYVDGRVIGKLCIQVWRNRLDSVGAHRIQWRTAVKPEETFVFHKRSLAAVSSVRGFLQGDDEFIRTLTLKSVPLSLLSPFARSDKSSDLQVVCYKTSFINSVSGSEYPS